MRENFRGNLNMENQEVVGGFNPDRVKTKEEIKNVVIQPGYERKEIVKRVIETRPGWLVNMYGPTLGKVENVARAMMLTSLVGTVASNVGIESQSGSSNEHLTDNQRIEDALKTVDIGTMVDKTQEEVCKVIDANFMHRFITKDEEGKESFNPGGFVIPFAVELSSDCKAKVDVELHIPYDFARTFTEISAKNPSAREEMAEKLAKFITQSVQDQTVIRGIAGVTDTTYVYNRATNMVFAGKPIVDLGKFDIKNVALEGVASAEAEASKMNPKAESLRGENPENVKLAGKRLEDAKPFIVEALQKSGVDTSVFDNAKNFSYEHNLSSEEIASFAAISRDVLGGVIGGSEEQVAYDLIEEINNGNTEVLAAIDENPKYVEIIDNILSGSRGVNIKFEADTEYQKNTVYNISVLLPLGLLLLPGIHIRRVPGEKIVVDDVQVVEVPPVEGMETAIKPIARRLFSETTPSNLGEERDFNDIYESINLSERSGDTHALLQHMLIEEVLPSLDEKTREPMIDYEAIVNRCRQYLFSDTREEGGVAKGRYATPEEAQRKITEELLEMWERHDAATYPMRGIDIKTVLNYRHSEHVARWAKTLAYEFIRLAEQTQTTDDFRSILRQAINDALETRKLQGNTNRNKFVKSDFPLENPNF